MGARSPLGLNALQVATAIRAKKREVRTCSFYDRRNARVGAVFARFLPEDLCGAERLARLAEPALAEAAATLAAPVPLFLGLAGPERPDLPAGIEGEVVDRLLRRGELQVDAGSTQLFRSGHASFAFALEGALRALSQGAPAALVGCVDSYFDPRAIAWLDEAYRLHAHGVEDGVIPSEGAAFALLVAAELKDARVFGPFTPPPLAVVRHVGTASEPEALVDDGPIVGAALTELVQRALTALPAPPAWLMTDIDEAHRNTEWLRVELRCRPAFDEVTHERLPDRIGDTGAATGALGAAYACQSFVLGGAPGGSLLIAGSADGPPRGVVILEEAR